MQDSIKKLRRTAQTDLFFLAKELLGYKEITERTHRVVAQFFVQKNPDKPIKDQDTVKDRLLLDPRGAFKSTFNIADCVQWIICFPDIRLLILTGEASLGNGFIEELQSHFIKGDGEPTAFQELFPEFCIPPEDKYVGKFTCPCRKKHWKEPTVMSSSIESSLSGWHFEGVKLDDVVNNANSETEAALAKVNKNIHINRKMLMPWGYWDLVGTRYHSKDAYGEAMNKAEGGELKVLHRSAWWPTASGKLKRMEEWEPQDCELLFPENLTFKFLQKELRKDPLSFFSQYMNDPIGAQDVAFLMSEMRNATLPHSQLPTTGKIAIAWDLAYTRELHSDYSAGVVARIHEGRIYVVDLVYGRFREDEMAAKIVETARRWGTTQTAIEQSLGVRLLEQEIQRYARASGWELNVTWLKVDTTLNAKKLRIRSLQPLVVRGQLRFSGALPNIDELYEQFCDFNMTDRNQRDDIPDAVGHLLRYLPRATVDVEREQARMWEELTRKDLHDKLYGQGRYSPALRPAPPAKHDYLTDSLVPGLNC